MQTPFGAEGDGLRWARGLVMWQRSNKDFCLFGKLRLITLNNVAGSRMKRVRFILRTVVMDSAGICRISWTGTHQICIKSLLLMPRTHTYTHTVNEYGAMSFTANNPAARFISKGVWSLTSCSVIPEHIEVSDSAIGSNKIKEEATIASLYWRSECSISNAALWCLSACFKGIVHPKMTTQWITLKNCMYTDAFKLQKGCESTTNYNKSGPGFLKSNSSSV